MATLREEDEGKQSIKLLTLWASPYGMRALIGLEEKGIHYESVEQNLQNKSPLLLQMNPIHKKVPVLIHGGRPVAESLILLQYIDETWPSSNSTAFLPCDPYDRAIARFWADFLDNKVCYPGMQIFRTKGEEQDAAKAEFLQNLLLAEGELNGKDYFGGDKFGLVDIALIPFISWFHTFESLGKFKISLEEKYPNITAWRKRCLERASVNKALPPPEKVLEFAIQIRKRVL
ncbi:hypothetical protein KI387_000752, partial [Taxus chinensis]